MLDVIIDLQRKETRKQDLVYVYRFLLDNIILILFEQENNNNL